MSIKKYKLGSLIQGSLLQLLESQNAIARPFLKWAGGKGQLLAQIDKYLPAELEGGNIENYVEPFIGGGAVFFFIQQKFNISNSYIFDTNPELIIAYVTVKNAVEELITKLQELEKFYHLLEKSQQRTYFYEVRNLYNSAQRTVDYSTFSDDWVTRTSQTIFLNRTCFNGLFRVNSKGEFNVPFGDYKNPKICDRSNLYAVSKQLKNTEIQQGDFSISKKYINNKTFVYFDPPYRPISTTASFNSYSKEEFNDNEQLRLASYFRDLDLKGAKLMLSNSDPQNINPMDTFFEDAYKGFEIKKVKAFRNINSKHEGRGQIDELLIMNYKKE